MPLSLLDQVQSKRNSIFFGLRQKIQFSRDRYQETGISDAEILFSDWEMGQLGIHLGEKYGLENFRKLLNIHNYKKNLSTLWILEEFYKERPNPINILEAGAQDFSRLPALRAFFQIPILGLELDAFPILSDLSSRYDRAQYYIRTTDKISKFQVGNFFHHNSKYSLIIAFYPFVSPHPALAWGLPASFGSAELWVKSVDRNLTTGGQALIMHQENSLELLQRKILQCPFGLTPYPAHVSLYQKQ